MTILKRCVECDAVMWSLAHVCKPVFLVWLPDDGEAAEDAREIRAADAEQAAEIVAENYDVDDRTLLKGHRLSVLVQSSDGTITKFEVTAEADVTYTAHETE